jgi:ribonuclease BN (tRNA processing enzyme)
MMPSTDAYLMDCGEDTIGQIHRIFGYDGADKIVFAKLKLIFISHLHADHHLGFISLAQRWLQVTPETAKLVVVAPLQFLKWINEYQSFESIDWRNRVEFYNSVDFDYTLSERTRCDFILIIVRLCSWKRISDESRLRRLSIVQIHSEYLL